MPNDEREEGIEIPIPASDSEAERQRIRSSNDRDQELEREGESSRHNRGYDEAAKGGDSRGTNSGADATPQIERAVDEE